MAPRSERRLYRLEPLDASGVFLGLGVVQSVLLGLGLVTAVVAVSAGFPLPVAAAPVLGAVAASFARVGGRPVWELGLDVASWLWARAGRGPSWFARLPLAGPWPPEAPLPPCLEGLSVLEVPGRAGHGVAAVRDATRHTLTAAVPVRGPQFALAPADEQERLLAGFGDVLNQFAMERSPVTHVAWVDAARPSGMAQHLVWVEGHERGRVPLEAAASYDELVGEATGAASTHEVLVTLTVSRQRLGRRRARVGDPEEALARALCSSLDALGRSLRSAGLDAGDPLDPGALARALRARIDPGAAQPRLVEGRLVERLGLVTPASAGPLALETTWGHVRVDGAFHRTFWVASWPRLAVPPSWLEPFLSAQGVTRTMAVVFAPVPAHQSRRRIERDLVKLDSDAATKEEKGRRVDARHRRTTKALLEREEEIVSGFAEVAYTGLVTVTAPSEEQLERDSEVTEQLAREAGLELRALVGRQDLGFAATLPLGLAPKSLLA